MTPAQRQEIETLFERALEIDPANVAAWLAEASADAAVRVEVDSLLRHHRTAGSFLTRPALELVGHLGAEDDEQMLVPGAAIGPYTIVREVGRGGMGRVFLANDTRLGRAVAIKAVAPQVTRDAAHRERLRREARAAAALSHPGICAVYALEEVGAQLFMVSEFIEGRTLREEIDSGERPSVRQVLDTARELSSAVAAAHAQGLVHRDLTPANVMRTTDGRLKVLDFGLARRTELAPMSDGVTITAPGTLVGTPAYMSPEQLTGKAVGLRTDVFALGVLTYEYATGAHPFAAPSPIAMLARILEGAPTPLDRARPDLPLSLVRPVHRALEKDPADRFESATEMAAALTERHDRSSIVGHGRRWWKIHQAASIALYVAAALAAWTAKEAQPDVVAAAAFIAVGVLATIAGILRGHLLFTERVHTNRIELERRRTTRTQLGVDLALAAALFVGGASAASAHPLTGVLTMALAVAIALAATLIEPSTTAEAFRHP